MFPGSEMNFASDNTAPVAPDILDPILEANCGFARGYGNDEAFLVPTGTAANALALAQVSPPWGVVLCHNASHIATDECGAPEFFGHGLRLEGLPGEGGHRRAPASRTGGHSPHQMVPAALSWPCIWMARVLPMRSFGSMRHPPR